jgi:hypothetical protein
MDGESLVELKAAFDAWRRRKRYVREAVPVDLMRRACAAVRHHGPAAVARATKVDQRRLKTTRRGRSGRKAPAASVPTYSRLDLTAPATATVTPRPFAEIEIPTGLKVRLFTEAGEALVLLSSLLGAGGPR